MIRPTSFHLKTIIIIIAHSPGHFLSFRHLLVLSRWWRKDGSGSSSITPKVSALFLSLFLWQEGNGKQDAHRTFAIILCLRLDCTLALENPFLSLFFFISSALLEPAQEHPKAALDFYRTKMVTASRHYKTGVCTTYDEHVRIVFFELTT